VKDAGGQELAFVYYEEEPGRRTAAKLMTQDGARRIAVNIAKLPNRLGPYRRGTLAGARMSRCAKATHTHKAARVEGFPEELAETALWFGGFELRSIIRRSTIAPRGCAKVDVSMRAGALAIVLMATASICGCTSESVPSWAIAAANSPVMSRRVLQHVNPTHASSSDSMGSIMVGSTAGPPNSKGRRIFDTSQPTDLAATSSAPSKEGDIKSLMKEWIRHDQEEDKRIDATINLCRC
jgi:hypothetical protein